MSRETIKEAEILLSHLTVEHLENKTPPPAQNSGLPPSTLQALDKLIPNPTESMCQVVNQVKHGVTKKVEQSDQPFEGDLFHGVRCNAVGSVLEGLVNELMGRQQLKDGLVFIPGPEFIEVMQHLYPGSVIVVDDYGQRQLVYQHKNSRAPIYHPDGAKVDQTGKLKKLVECTARPSVNYIMRKQKKVDALQNCPNLGLFFKDVSVQLALTADPSPLANHQNELVRRAIEEAKRVGFRVCKLYNFVDEHIISPILQDSGQGNLQPVPVPVRK